MKTRFFTFTLLSLITCSLIAGDLDGYWRSTDQNRDIEVMYTTHGIKVRPSQYSNDWENYNRFENNRYRDQRGNCFSLIGNILEWCTPDRRNIVNYNKYNQNDSYIQKNEQEWNGREKNKDWNRRDNDRRWNENSREGWNRKDRDSWASYYKAYEGKWHNHTTGEHIHVDLSRRSLKIKFHGERWHEVFERNRGLFVDQRGNEFVFRNDRIEFRSSDGDLLMRFYCDDRCDHRDEYRSEYWR